MLPIVCNTHSSAFDVLRVYVGQLEKYWFPRVGYVHDGRPTSYIVANERPECASSHHGLLLYNAADPHYLQCLKVLAELPHDYFIYVHEDFLLHDEIDFKELDFCLQVMRVLRESRDKSLHYSYVRLLKSGCVDLGEKRVIANLWEVPLGLANFSMQATIWYKPDLMAILEAGQVKDVRDELDYSYAADSLGIRGLYHHAGSRQRGRNHWDSSVFPYIATAINKGRWGFGEYPELLDVLCPYNIDPDVRGVV